MKVNFVRLAPTTLYRAPNCYGNYNVRCTLVTGKCPVEHQCITRQAPEEKEVKE